MFDGVCHFCNGVVMFMARNEEGTRLRFAHLQSESGRRLLRQYGLSLDTLDSIVLIDGGQVYLKSDAVVRLTQSLSRPWRYIGALGYAPRAVRDVVYDFVGRHRYRLFGKANECVIPSEDILKKFLK
nr:DCC1-like thiol-disulfide oxidoreductase family protein [Acidovorax sp. CCYZU-2555]